MNEWHTEQRSRVYRKWWADRKLDNLHVFKEGGDAVDAQKALMHTTRQPRKLLILLEIELRRKRGSV
jgi:hypothetical protein